MNKKYEKRHNISIKNNLFEYYNEKTIKLSKKKIYIYIYFNIHIIFKYMYFICIKQKTHIDLFLIN